MIDRGFITIATGDMHYYKIAANLLLSYRYFSKEPLPFAIIAEEENEYTALFDDVIITNEAMRSFNDKFLLMKLCPYKESIFLDADCLAFDDIDLYWDLFKDATDFSAFGINVDLSDNNGAWYNVDGIGKYGKMIDYKCRVHAGVMFIRNSPKLTKLYYDCMELLLDYDSLYFHSWVGSTDECVLGVVMPMNYMKTVREDPNLFTIYPGLKKLKANVYTGQLEYQPSWCGYIKKGVLLHWGTDQTKQPLYKFNVECLEYLSKKKKSLWSDIKYRYKLRLLVLHILDIPRLINWYFFRFKRLIRKLFGRKD